MKVYFYQIFVSIFLVNISFAGNGFAEKHAFLALHNLYTCNTRDSRIEGSNPSQQTKRVIPLKPESKCNNKEKTLIVVDGFRINKLDARFANDTKWNKFIDKFFYKYSFSGSTYCTRKTTFKLLDGMTCGDLRKRVAPAKGEGPSISALKKEKLYDGILLNPVTNLDEIKSSHTCSKDLIDLNLRKERNGLKNFNVKDFMETAEKCTFSSEDSVVDSRKIKEVEKEGKPTSSAPSIGIYK